MVTHSRHSPQHIYLNKNDKMFWGGFPKGGILKMIFDDAIITLKICMLSKLKMKNTAFKYSLA